MRPRPWILVLVLLTVSSSARAWVQDGVAVSPAPGQQYLGGVVSDGAGGMIVTWSDARTGFQDIYAQRLDGDGIALWTVVVCGATDNQWWPVVASDGAGGAVIVWEDDRLGSSNTDIYAQRVGPDGSFYWASNGIPVCTAAGKQQQPRVVTEGAVSYTTWHDNRSGDRDIYVQKLDGSGGAVWAADGAAVCTAANDQESPRLIADGQGGAIVTWNDLRNGVDSDIYAQAVNFLGTPVWTSNGVAVVALPEYQSAVQIVSDGAYGAVMAWQDYRGGTDYDVYAQRLDYSGTALWTSNGTSISALSGYQTIPVLVADGTGGAIIAWEDSRSGTDYDVYAQHVNGLGAALWLADGAAIRTGPGYQGTPSIVSDGEDGVVIAWEDTQSGAADLYAQRLDPNGLAYWTSGGVAITTAPSFQSDMVMTSDTSGAVLVAWTDYRSGLSNIYAQRIEPRHGYWGRPEAVITSASDNPEDQGGEVALNWKASERGALLYQEISHYSIWRAVDPASVAPALAEQGLVSLEAVGPEYDGPAYRIQHAAAGDYYWELVSTQTAIYLPAYSALVPTRQDSTGGDPAVHYFQVVAHANDPGVFFPSAPDSAYSVDNLSPAAPLTLAAARAGGSLVDLDWSPSGFAEPDFQEYRLYRGTTSGFPTDASHFLLATADTMATDGAADPGQEYYYRAVSADVHGNESDASNEAMVSAVSTGAEDLGARLTSLRLRANAPNPFGGLTELRIGLPEDADVTLEVYDVLGRRVYERTWPRMERGWTSVGFAGRDAEGRLLPSGVYFYRVSAGGEVRSRKMVIRR
jgi:hypothetical protein